MAALPRSLSLGELIRLRLKRSRLTQEDLVERTGLSMGTISKVINGHVRPRASSLKKIARALSMRMSDLEPGYPEDGVHAAFRAGGPAEAPALGIPVVGEEAGKSGKDLFRPAFDETLAAGRWKALKVTTDRFAPLARAGQYLLISEEPVAEGDRVFCELRDGRQYVAVCSFRNVARTEFELRDPTPRANRPLTVKESDVAGLHRLVGVKF